MNPRARRLLLPWLAVAAIVAAWDLGIRWFQVKDYLLPAPLAVVRALADGLAGGSLWPHIGTTLAEIASGYAAGCALALLLAALVCEFTVLEEAVYPLMAGIQSIPKVALAPILMVWFGFDIESKIIMVALVCFFPTFVNTYAGLHAADADLLALYRAFGARRWQSFAGVKVPAAVPSVFAGLEISVVMALIGAVVAELVASRRGLGYVIASSGANFNVAVMFACVALLAAIGIVLTQFVRWGRRRLVFWERSAGRLPPSP